MTSAERRDHALFAYFTSQDDADGEQVRFARSEGIDLLHWESLADGRPVLLSTVGTGGVRDPFLIRSAGLAGETAVFYLIATDLRVHDLDPDTAWDEAQRHGSRSIVVWESSDLIHWSAPRLAEVAPPDAGNAWAPEAIFDQKSQRYFVFWASTRQDGVSPGYNRMLASWTVDFRSFTTPTVWVDPGWSVIDATVVHHKGAFYRLLKDERSADSTLPTAKYLTLERSRELDSTRWELVQDGIGSALPVTGTGLRHGEGPILLRNETSATWLLLIDEFQLRGYIPFEASDLAGDWTMCESYRLPTRASHGSIVPISESEWQSLAGIAEADAGSRSA
ncbi:MAG: glycoside hydrolase family 43 protein [Pseudolysinimonas sp.]